MDKQDSHTKPTRRTRNRCKSVETPLTSTPNSYAIRNPKASASLRKEKASPYLVKNRKRAKMAGDDNMEEEDPFKKMTDLINNKFDRADAKMDEFKGELGNKIDSAVAKSAENALSIEKINRELAALKSATMNQEKRQRPDLEHKLDQLAKKVDRMDAISAAQNAGRPNQPAPSSIRNENSGYWEARRKLWISPIRGPDSDLWKNTGNFLFQKLLVRKDDVTEKSVVAVTRVPRGKRVTRIQDEVVVTFCDVQTRDMVARHATNLGRLNGTGDLSNVRLEIPDSLTGVFRTLEQHAHEIRNEFGKGLKRRIKFDDVEQTLFMDICLPNEVEWMRVDYEFAQEETKHKRKTTVSARSRLKCAANRQKTNQSQPPNADGGGNGGNGNSQSSTDESRSNLGNPGKRPRQGQGGICGGAGGGSTDYSAWDDPEEMEECSWNNPDL